MKFERVNVREDNGKILKWFDMELSLVQILGTVAIIQMKNLKIEVEKGFRWTMFEPELVDPNVKINFDNELNGYRMIFIFNIIFFEYKLILNYLFTTVNYV
jgi:hypothetical protein